MVEVILLLMGAAFFIVMIAALSKEPGTSVPHCGIHLPDGSEYVDKNPEIPHTDGSLADKVDSRFTNIVRNPWEDIL